jgi:hypothetical protein
MATITFSGCKAIGFPANTSTSFSGTIVTPPLSGELCEISKASKTVGSVIFLTETLVVEVPLAKQTIEVNGSAIGEVKPVGKKQSTSELFFTQKDGAQMPSKCEGGPELTLLANEAKKGFKQAGLATTEQLTYSQQIEVTSS